MPATTTPDVEEPPIPDPEPTPDPVMVTFTCHFCSESVDVPESDQPFHHDGFRAAFMLPDHYYSSDWYSRSSREVASGYSASDYSDRTRNYQVCGDCFDEQAGYGYWYCSSCDDDHIDLDGIDDVVNHHAVTRSETFHHNQFGRAQWSSGNGQSGCSTPYCEHCGNRVRDLSNYDEGDSFSDHCTRCSPAPGQVQSWDYTPTLHFRDDRDGDDSDTTPVPGTPYLGMEVETERMDSYQVLTVANAFNGDAPESWVYFKRDGSLGDRGIEMVSHPATLDRWMADFPWQGFDAAFKAGARGYSESSCGIHIHLSASSLSAAHLFKFLAFHYRNPQVCQRVGQRGSVHYGSWSEWLATRPDVVKFAKKEAKPGSRYMAVNLTEDETIELRYFRSNLNPSRLRKNLQWVDAVYRYTKQVPGAEADEGLRFRAMIPWLAEPTNQERYPDLIAFLNDRGLADIPTDSPAVAAAVAAGSDQ